MAQTMAQKLRIKPGYTLMTMQVPAGFERGLGSLPDGVSLAAKSSSPDQVHCFVKDRAGLEKAWPRLRKMMKPGLLIWFYYPKGSSGLQTDLTRDKGWECMDADRDRLGWVNLISFNDTWSAAGFRVQEAKAGKTDARKEPDTSAWIDKKNRIVTVPPDLEKLLRKHPSEKMLFDALSYTHRKEYVEWVVTAKKPETRAKRVEGTIERLKAQLKNKQNR